MNKPEAPGQVLWQRKLDAVASSKRWRRFLRWYVLPMSVVLAGGALVGGMGTFLGLLILLGILGGMLALWIAAHGALMRQNPEIRLVDGALVQGRRTVPIDAIEAWTTHRRTRMNRSDVPTPVAQVIFRVPLLQDGKRGVRPDGTPALETVHFPWGEMSQEELDTVKQALEPHIPAAWVPPGHLMD